jgi:hypothetical protein
MRCPKGFVQNPPKSGNCVKTSTSKRCPPGTRKNKKTGECDKKNEILSRKVVKKSTPLKKSTLIMNSNDNSQWKITHIAYTYPYGVYMNTGDINITGINLTSDKGQVLDFDYLNSFRYIPEVHYFAKQKGVGAVKISIDSARDMADPDYVILDEDMSKIGFTPRASYDEDNLSFIHLYKRQENDNEYVYKRVSYRNLALVKDGKYGKHYEIQNMKSDKIYDLNKEHQKQVYTFATQVLLETLFIGNPM